MVNTSRLFEMARKWKRMAVLGRKRISWTIKISSEASTLEKTITDKGHFIIYTSEGKRFMVPLAFLSNSIFEELLKMSEEEFGLCGDGPITLPCDAAFFEFALLMLRRTSKAANNECSMSVLRSCSNSLVLNARSNRQLSVF